MQWLQLILWELFNLFYMFSGYCFIWILWVKLSVWSCFLLLVFHCLKNVIYLLFIKISFLVHSEFCLISRCKHFFVVHYTGVPAALCHPIVSYSLSWVHADYTQFCSLLLICNEKNVIDKHLLCNEMCDYQARQTLCLCLLLGGYSNNARSSLHGGFVCQREPSDHTTVTGRIMKR